MSINGKNIQEITLTELSGKEHTLLWYKLTEPPFDQEPAKRLEQQLTVFFEQYHQLLTELCVAVENYRDIVALINARQPLVKRKEPQQL